MTEPAMVSSPLPYEKLEANVASGHVDTVLVVFADLQGRLQGKRVHAQHFLGRVREFGLDVPSELLAVDVDNRPIGGFGDSHGGAAFGDVLLRPDLSTLRAVPWQPACAMVQCDVRWPDGRPVEQSPRQMLRRQVETARACGFTAIAGTKLQFTVFEETYARAAEVRHRGLMPSTRHVPAASVLATHRIEPMLRDLRNAMVGAGVEIEALEGHHAPGQYEITFRVTDVLTMADQHAVFKAAAKEIAFRHEASVTFMAKHGEAPGNAGHLHLSLRGPGGGLVFAPQDPLGVDVVDLRTDVFRHVVAGVLETLPDFTLLYAPYVNSYKRLGESSSASTAVTWGEDNRTCTVRVLGRGPSLRLENRVPGADANPYLALAAMLAGGLHGIGSCLPLRAPFIGNAAESDHPRIPASLAAARDAFATSVVAGEVFDKEVVAHYVRAADAELAAFAGAVTDWELTRGFERL
ncbi:MAG: glutamine synthetase [Actinomycetales bacterium]|nr:glutamine synthetase [Actinomycetales bacterium]